MLVEHESAFRPFSGSRSEPESSISNGTPATISRPQAAGEPEWPGEGGTEEALVGAEDGRHEAVFMSGFGICVRG